jgi:hypothetical protein
MKTELTPAQTKLSTAVHDAYGNKWFFCNGRETEAEKNEAENKLRAAAAAFAAATRHEHYLITGNAK